MPMLFQLSPVRIAVPGGDFFDFVSKHRDCAPKVMVAVMTLFLSMKWRFLHNLPITRTFVSLPNLVLAFVMPNHRTSVRARRKVQNSTTPPIQRTCTHASHSPHRYSHRCIPFRSLSVQKKVQSIA